MMSLDEAIKHCEEVAEAEEQKLKDWKGDYSHLQKIDSCKECASDHRQLAEWLKELKEYRDDCDYKTLKIKLENAEDIIRGLQEDLRDARDELNGR